MYLPRAYLSTLRRAKYPLVLISLVALLWGVDLEVTGRHASGQGFNRKLASSPIPGPLRVEPVPGKLTIALVNHVQYHMEVVAGFLQLAKKLDGNVVIFQKGGTDHLKAKHFTSLVPHPLPIFDTSDDVEVLGIDLAILISPEYHLDETLEYLDKYNISKSIFLVHNGNHKNIKTASSWQKDMVFAALAPHVAQFVEKQLKRPVEWLLPVLPFRPGEPCTKETMARSNCLDGFAVQGNFEGHRRNYTSLWDQLQVAKFSKVEGVHVHLLGKGNLTNLKMPPSVTDMVTVHSGLPFPAFYKRIYHCYAMLAVFGNPSYYTTKISSTLVTSLITGVPAVVEPKFLRTYTMFSNATVFEMKAGEQELDAMRRMLELPAESLLEFREKLVMLRKELLRVSLVKVQKYLSAGIMRNTLQK